MKGKWYITFTWLDTFDSLGGTVTHEMIPLDVTTEDEAVDRAPKGLRTWVEAAKAAWEGQGKVWPEPEPGSKYAPEHYSVIYKIDIK